MCEIVAHKPNIPKPSICTSPGDCRWNYEVKPGDKVERAHHRHVRACRLEGGPVALAPGGPPALKIVIMGDSFMLHQIRRVLKNSIGKVCIVHCRAGCSAGQPWCCDLHCAHAEALFVPCVCTVSEVNKVAFGLRAGT